MNWYLIIKTIHIVSATLLFGTGLGIAFFMFRSRYTDNPHEKLYAARNTVLADYLFTLPAAIAQPLSGAWLVWYTGYHWNDGWLLVSYGLYITATLFWLPVVWIQIQLKKIAMRSLAKETAVPERYYRLFRIWFWMGWPAFSAFVVIFYLMVAKPL